MQNGKEAAVQIMDMQGRVMLTEIMQSEAALNVGHFPAGTYTVRIVSEGRTGARRFVKQ
jgi:hypothetical protein